MENHLDPLPRRPPNSGIFFLVIEEFHFFTISDSSCALAFSAIDCKKATSLQWRI